MKGRNEMSLYIQKIVRTYTVTTFECSSQNQCTEHIQFTSGLDQVLLQFDTKTIFDTFNRFMMVCVTSGQQKQQLFKNIHKKYKI